MLEGGDSCLRPSRSVLRTTKRITTPSGPPGGNQKAHRPVPLRPIPFLQSLILVLSLLNAPPQATAAPRPSRVAVRRQPPDLAEGIFSVIRSTGCLPFVSTYDGTTDRVYYEKILNDGMQQHLDSRKASHDPRLRKIDRLADAFSDRVVCLTVIDRSEVVVKVRKAIEETYPDQAEMHFYEDTYAPGWSWLTVNDLKATKGRAIQTLTRLAGLDDGEVVAFGDHTNDIEMFRVAHRSFAVANAKDELKTRATGTIGSNEEDSVIRFIQADCRERTPAG